MARPAVVGFGGWVWNGHFLSYSVARINSWIIHLFIVCCFQLGFAGLLFWWFTVSVCQESCRCVFAVDCVAWINAGDLFVDL